MLWQSKKPVSLGTTQGWGLPVPQASVVSTEQWVRSTHCVTTLTVGVVVPVGWWTFSQILLRQAPLLARPLALAAPGAWESAEALQTSKYYRYTLQGEVTRGNHSASSVVLTPQRSTSAGQIHSALYWVMGEEHFPIHSKVWRKQLAGLCLAFSPSVSSCQYVADHALLSSEHIPWTPKNSY